MIKCLVGLSGRTDELALWPANTVSGSCFCSLRLSKYSLLETGGVTWAELGQGITSAPLKKGAPISIQAGSREASTQQGPWSS